MFVGGHARGAPADAAPGRDARGLRALRLPRRHVGPAAPHQHVPRGHHVRRRRRRPARRSTLVRRIHVAVTGTMPDGTSYAASDPHLLALGARRRGRQLPAVAPGLRRRAARPGRAGTRTSPQAGEVAARLGAVDPPTHRGRARRGAGGVPPRAARDPRGPRGGPRRAAGSPPLPLAARPAYAMLRTAAIALMPDWSREPLRPADATAARPHGRARHGSRLHRHHPLGPAHRQHQRPRPPRPGRHLTKCVFLRAEVRSCRRGVASAARGAGSVARGTRRGLTLCAAALAVSVAAPTAAAPGRATFREVAYGAARDKARSSGCGAVQLRRHRQMLGRRTSRRTPRSCATGRFAARTRRRSSPRSGGRECSCIYVADGPSEPTG